MTAAPNTNGHAPRPTAAAPRPVTNPGPFLDDGAIEVLDGAEALSAMTRGEIDVQIATARRFPRSVRVFLDTAQEMATINEETAASCFYTVPRDGKYITGPSVRLAEICASAWTNLRVASRILSQDERWIVAEAYAWDMQTNVAVGIQVRRRITTKGGRTFGDDMISTTANAAISIAVRNAIFRVVPNAYVNMLFAECRKVAVGDAKTLNARRDDCVASFAKMGVAPETIYGFFGIKGHEEITLEHLGVLRGLFTAIRDGETTIEEAFAVKTPSPADAVNAAVAQPAAGAAAPTPAPAASTPPADAKPAAASIPPVVVPPTPAAKAKGKDADKPSP